jgi:uncharacterized membrane protein
MIENLLRGLRELPNIHPLVVHFPIVLLPAALALDLAGLAARRGELHRVARWALWLGTVATALAVITGHRGADVVEPYLSAEAAADLSRHHDLGLVTLGTAAAVSLWRLLVRNPFPTRARLAYVALAIGSVATLVVGADLGGRLVYRHGVAVRVGADSLYGGAAPFDAAHSH